MPEKGLDGADIRPVFEEMCGKGMTIIPSWNKRH